ncbi:C4-dicarboxylate TRAP transporter substrate-binding protein [Castellaniella sp. S9]|uniref:C4-dicarboxylate TRAP transporter substrate-binding protein n=1 Tax=Castellaniella sp. S9 TaxID=2993652 RepID=UPI0022B487D6|nr:C4-dicarboxylate TRAP transporter substrate-binding protein [Castellaniella sp. S9]
MFKKAFLLGAMAFALNGVAHSAEYPKMTLRLAHAFPATTIQSKTDQWWADEIKKRSDGQITVRIFWAESLGKSTEILDLVSKGAVDLGATFPSYYPAQLPLSGAPNALPMVFRDASQAQKVMTALAETKLLVAEHKRNNVRPLFYHSLNRYHTLCTKPVTTVDDYKNLRIRSYGQFVPQLWDALGAKSVNATTSEIYDGLSRGNLDCAYYSYDLTYIFKLHEAAKHQGTANFGALSTYPIYVNETLWEKWPAEVRDLIAQISKEASERTVKEVQAAEADAIEGMKAAGVTFHEFKDDEKLQEVTPDFMTLWQTTMDKQGLGAEAKEVVADWRELLKKY